MLNSIVYPIIGLIVTIMFTAFAAVLILRLILSYADPNPFSAVGRFSFKIRKITERVVYPFARFLAGYRIDTRLAPIVTILIAGAVAYFGLQIIGNTFFVIDGFTTGVMLGKPMVIVGFILYGFLSVLVLFIFIRFLSFWFAFKRNTFLGFVNRVTNPILVPVQKMIPPIGMLDLSAMIVLIVINLLQGVVLRIFVYS